MPTSARLKPRPQPIPCPTWQPAPGFPILTIAVTALALFLPTLFFGIPSGHDFEFHLNSWMEVLSQWRLGILYPRWAALAHFGYGEARFIFYPPASWILGAALGSFLPWWIVPTVYEWIALTLSGLLDVPARSPLHASAATPPSPPLSTPPIRITS